MCGRVIQSSGPLRLAIVEGLDVGDSRVEAVRPRYNAAPSQELLVIRQNHKTGQRSLDLLRWGLVPHWCHDPSGGRRPINAKAESVSRLPMFTEAYAHRRCIVPVDGFFEWRAIKGARAKQPYAIAMKDSSPFGLAGLWENWRNPKTGEWERTFAIITVPSNELVGQIHNRMPAILERLSYDRWLGRELDPSDLLITYPSEPMTMWPISRRVNKPENDDRSLLDRVTGLSDAWAPLDLRPEDRSARRSLDRMAEVQLQSTLTCPHCGHQATEIMPTDACVAFYDCKGCGETLKPLPGSCCVFCSYGSVPCPPIQRV